MNETEKRIRCPDDQTVCPTCKECVKGGVYSSFADGFIHYWDCPRCGKGDSKRKKENES